MSNVSNILQLSALARIAEQIEDKFRGCELKSYPFETYEGKQNMTIISKKQLYFVMIRSRSPIAKKI